MLWSYAFGERFLITSFKEQVQDTLGKAEPWHSPQGYVWWRDNISHVFGVEGKMQNLAALTVLGGMLLSLLPEKNGFVRLCYSLGCCAKPAFCQKNM